MSLTRSILYVLLVVSSNAAEPLHVRIDRLIDDGQVGAVAGQSTDTEFIRRVYLDLTGRIPSSTAARTFIDSKAADKRAKVIDQLLGSDEYARHMAVSFDVMLMERRADKHVKTPEWRQYLFDSFLTNKSWDKIVGEIFTSEGDKNATTAKVPFAAAKFIMDRDMEVNLVTRDISRKFFGMDLQCAQCHDHPTIDDFYQRDYYGIYAFLSRSYIFQPDKKKPALLAEKPTGEVSFKSVFTDVSGRTRPRLPLSVEIDEPEIKPGEEYLVKPDKKKKNLRPIPRYSRRAKLAELATDNRMFQRNIANRLWGHVMGRAVVEPRDGLHTGNPAAHPALLELLADGLVEMKFDMRAFIREVALAKAYQRSFRLPGRLIAPDEAELHNEYKRKSAAADVVQKEFDAAKEALDKSRSDRLAGNAQIDKVQKMLPAAKKALDATIKPLADSEKVLAAKQAKHKPVAAAVAPAKAASEAVKDNKELAAAYTKIKSEAGKYAAEVAAAQKDVDAKTAANKTAKDKLVATEKSVLDAREQWAIADKAVQSGDKKWIAMAAKREQAKNISSVAMRRWEDAQALSELSASKVDLVAAEKALTVARDELKNVQAEQVVVAGELPALQASMVVAQKASNIASADRAAQQKLVDEKTVQAKAAADAVTQCVEASKLLAQALVVKTNDAEGMVLKAKLSSAKMRADEAAVKARVLDDLFKQEVAMLSKLLDQRDAVAKDATAKFLAAQKAVTNVQARITEAKKLVDAAQAKAALAATTQRESNERLRESVKNVAERWSRNVATGAFTHLTPEQLGWSILQATDQIDTYRRAGAADYEKKNPLKKDQKSDATRDAAKVKYADQYAHDKLKGSIANFIKLFVGAAGEVQTDFYATADQALYFTNGGTLRNWIAGNYSARLGKLTDSKALAEELYLTILTRRPTVDEVDLVVKTLAVESKERTAIIQDIAWGLLTSAEFRFNH